MKTWRLKGVAQATSLGKSNAEIARGSRGGQKDLFLQP